MATITSQFEQPLAGEVTFEHPGETHTQHRMAQLFFACFWTIVFTGSVRKWIFPGTQALYVLQEIPITIAYIYALSKGAYLRGILFFGIIGLSAAVTVQAFLQVIVIDLSPVVAIIGLHHYLYYMPMMLIFPLCLTSRYRKDFVRWNIWAALPMLALSLAQAVSPPGAWVNKTSEGEAVGLAGADDVARISGPFNFPPYYGILICVALALCLGEWLVPASRRASRSKLLLAAATFSWAVIALISGSRQNILLCVAGAAGAGVVAIVTRSIRGIAMMALAIAALPITVGAVYLISPSEVETIYSRFTDTKTHSSYSLGGRIGENFYGWATEPDFSLTGKGVGLGVDAAHFGQKNANDFTYQLSESDPVRDSMELGTPIGFLWSIARYGFGFIMIGLGFRLARTSPHCLPLACALFAQLSGDLTRYSTMTFTQVMIGYSFILGTFLYPQDDVEESYTPELPPDAGFEETSAAVS